MTKTIEELNASSGVITDNRFIAIDGTMCEFCTYDDLHVITVYENTEINNSTTPYVPNADDLTRRYDYEDYKKAKATFWMICEILIEDMSEN